MEEGKKKKENGKRNDNENLLIAGPEKHDGLQQTSLYRPFFFIQQLTNKRIFNEGENALRKRI